METSEDKTTMATPHTPQSTPLEVEWIGQMSNHQSAKSASAQSASRDHLDLDENVETRNSPRPPEDPGDVTDGDVRHPDEPTEPPDDAESARVQGGKERVKADVSRGCADETAELGGSVVHENTDADVDRVAREKRRDAQVHGESTGTCRASERGGESVSTHDQATDDENDQHPSTDDGDIPGMPPTPPEPPDNPAQRQDESPSAGLEGEWKDVASCDTGPTTGKTDVPGVPGGDEDPRNQPKVAQNTSECECEHSKGRSRKYSPEGGQDG